MSHITSIGFLVKSEEEFNVLLGHAYDTGQSIKAPKGLYIQFSDPSGAELWLQVNEDKELIGLNPHFAGKGRFKVKLTHSMASSEDDPMDGGFYAWAKPDEADGEAEGAFPFVFDLPDFQIFNKLTLPSLVKIQLTLFAQRFDYFESEEEFLAAQPDDLRMATESFIPVGLLEEAEEEDTKAFGLVNGLILAVEEKINEYTKEPFFWFLLQTYGGTLDVVTPKQLTEDEDFKAGGILNAGGWLSGRVLLNE